MTSNEFDDELQNRLRSLNSDLAGSHMPGPSAARKRAAQRTRHQLTGSVLAGVAVVAIATVIIFRPGMPVSSNVPPAVPPSDTPSEQQTVAPTQTPTPDPTRTTPPPTPDPSIPDTALMTPEDIWDFNESNPQWQETQSADRPECFPELTQVGATEHAQTHFATEPGSAESMHMSHDVLLLPSGDADAAFDAVVEQVEECVPNSERDSEGTIVSPYLLAKGLVENVGDAAYLVEYITDYPDDPNADWFVEVGVARSGDYVSIISRWYVGQDKNQEGDYRTLAAATERMCQATNGSSCLNGEPTYEPEDTTPVESGDTFSLAPDPFLTDDDVNPVSGYGDGFVVGENAPPEAYVQELGYVCMDDFDAIGAVEWRHQVWDMGIQASVDNAVIQFPSAVDAEGWILDYTAINERCDAFGQIGEYTEIANYGVIDVDGADNAIAWLKSDTPPGVDHSFGGVGIAHRGNIGVMIRIGSMADPGNWEEYVTQRLAVALERAIG